MDVDGSDAELKLLLEFLDDSIERKLQNMTVSLKFLHDSSEKQLLQIHFVNSTAENPPSKLLEDPPVANSKTSSS
jgi:hypothetical protein